MRAQAEIDARSIYVGNVDYSVTPGELAAFFSVRRRYSSDTTVTMPQPIASCAACSLLHTMLRLVPWFPVGTVSIVDCVFAARMSAIREFPPCTHCHAEQLPLRRLETFVTCNSSTPASPC